MMITYKGWHKGTDGGSGLVTEFQAWDTSQYEKYDIDPETYDHSDITSRPAVLVHLYSKQRQPYKYADYLLS